MIGGDTTLIGGDTNKKGGHQLDWGDTKIRHRFETSVHSREVRHTCYGYEIQLRTAWGPLYRRRETGTRPPHADKPNIC